MNIWHDCPRCGRADSASGDSFCGSCEEEYQREQERQEAEAREERRQLSNRCWIHGTREQVQYIESLPRQDGALRMRVRRANGSTSILNVYSAEPAEVPGGGLILWLEPAEPINYV